MGKILAVTNTNLGGIEVIFETPERYFEKYDIFRDTDSGLEFFAVDRPRQNQIDNGVKKPVGEHTIPDEVYKL